MSVGIVIVAKRRHDSIQLNISEKDMYNEQLINVFDTETGDKDKE